MLNNDLTVAQTQKIIREEKEWISKRTIQRWCKNGKLKAKLFGKTYLINAKDLEEFIEKM